MSLTRRSFLATAAAPLALSAAAPKREGKRQARFVSAALAPLDKSGAIDDALTKEYLDYLSEGGVDGVLVNGSTGEFSSFSLSERKQNLEVFLRHKGSLTTMCQVGCPNQAEAIELLKHAQDSGADEALLLPPFYFNQPSTDGLVAFLEPVLDASEIPVLLYNIPQLSEVQITIELVKRLSGHERFAGIKDSWGKLDNTLAYIRQDPRLGVMTGASAQIQPVIEAGGAGALTGNGNVFPKQTKAIINAFNKGGDVSAAQAELNRLTPILKGYASAEAQKACLHLMGLGKMYVRAPFVNLTKAQREELAGRMRSVGVLG